MLIFFIAVLKTPALEGLQGSKTCLPNLMQIQLMDLSIQKK